MFLLIVCILQNTTAPQPTPCTHTTHTYTAPKIVLLYEQIFSIKTLVKSYLPIRDAHLRPGIEKVMDILKNILSFGDISKDIESRY